MYIEYCAEGMGCISLEVRPFAPLLAGSFVSTKEVREEEEKENQRRPLGQFGQLMPRGLNPLRIHGPNFFSSFIPSLSPPPNSVEN